MTLSDDYWIEVPGGTYTVGLLPDEVKRLAAESAAHFESAGPDYSSNFGKSFARAYELVTQHGKVEWVEQYLRETYPPREIEIAPFAIARAPVTVGLYRQFMRDTGEWVGLEVGDSDDDVLRGVPWVAAKAFVQWAGARLPFEAEWECAMRGHERLLSPRAWGREHDEWCADYWGEEPEPWRRVVRGGEARQLMASTVTRNHERPGSPAGFWHGIRLVRADGRTIPEEHPALPTRERLWMRVHEHELKSVRPTLESLRGSVVAELHWIEVNDRDYYDLDRSDRGAQRVKTATEQGHRKADFQGHFFTAVSNETVRRHPREHGVFAWHICYRFDDAVAQVRAWPVTAYRMAYDKQIHILEGRFRADEEDTSVDDLTAEMVRQHVLDSFAFYDEYADSDVPPPL